jgi:hypothetical protein
MSEPYRISVSTAVNHATGHMHQRVRLGESEFATHVMRTREAGIRDGLERLGWIDPETAAELRATLLAAVEHVDDGFWPELERLLTGALALAEAPAEGAGREKGMR